jgi:hypothetical protein
MTENSWRRFDPPAGFEPAHPAPEGGIASRLKSRPDLARDGDVTARTAGVIPRIFRDGEVGLTARRCIRNGEQRAASPSTVIGHEPSASGAAAVAYDQPACCGCGR